MSMKHVSIAVVLTGLLIGMLTRAWQFQERFNYAHDNDLASWTVKDIVFDKHPRLIGQLTSVQGVFIGPLFYYSLIPFYWITGWDPIGSVAWSWVIGIAAITSVYVLLRRLYGHTPAAIACLIYAASAGISGIERSVVPTAAVVLWSVWFYYAVNRLFQGHKKSLYGIAVLVSLIWHLNLALVLLTPLALIGVLLHRKNYTIKDILLPVLLCILLSAPLLAFEVRHNFVQTRAVFSSFTASDVAPAAGLSDKVSHVLRYVYRHASVVFIYYIPDWYSQYLTPAILLIGIAVLAFLKKIPRYTIFLFSAWILFYFAFFTLHPINLSEYYLDGLSILWITASSLILGHLFRIGQAGRILASVCLTLFLFHNINIFLVSHPGNVGYLQKKALVEFIASDSRSHGYPCISVSYMTNPGYNLGYRYLYWLNRLHVNQPVSLSPVYTIVFPHNKAGRLDRTFGGLGLVLPEYSRYSEEQVRNTCSGANANLTDPMLNFTK